MGSPSRKWTWFVGIALGLAVGLVLGRWADAPLHATATDRIETFAMATGAVDMGIEAVYFLDFLTGDLNAVVIGPAPRGYAATAHYSRNVLKDLGIDPGKNPKFLMTTGLAADLSLGRAGNLRFGSALVYVAEVTTGQCAVYALPWNAQARRTGTPIALPMSPITKFQFRQAGVGGAAKTKDE